MSNWLPLELKSLASEIKQKHIQNAMSKSILCKVAENICRYIY